MNRDNTGAVTALRAQFEQWADANGYGAKFRESMFAAYEAGIAASPPEDAPAVDGGAAEEWDIEQQRPMGHELMDALRESPCKCGSREFIDGQCKMCRLAAAPAPAVGREAVVGCPDCCPACQLGGATCGFHSRKPAPPAEAREPVGDATRMGLLVIADRIEAAMGEPIVVPGGAAHAIRALAQPQATPRDSGDAWISVRDRLPAWGQWIEGRTNVDHETWHEQFDPDEPLGRMIEWRALKKPAKQSPTGEPT